MAEFVTRKENQRRLILVVICAVLDTLALGGGIWFYKQANDIDHNDKKKDGTLSDLRSKISEVRRERQKIELAFQEWSQYVGWRTVALGTNDRVTTTGVNGDQMRAFLKERLDVLASVHSVTNLTPFNAQGEGTFTLVVLFDKLKELEDSYRAQCTQLESNIGTERTREQTAINAAATAEQTAMSIIKKSDTEGRVVQYTQQLKDFYNLQRDHDKELYGEGGESKGLEGEAFKASNALTDLRKKNLRAKTELDAKKVEYRVRRDWIIHRREEEKERRDPDGEILGVDAGSNVAYIDLLHSDRIFKGTRFKVYSLEKGGVKVDKGEIELTVVRERSSSVVAITKTHNLDDPIKAGDKIYNEYYEKGRQRYVVIAGKLTGRLSNEEAASLVKDFGDIYQEKVDQRTNYVVLGDGYETTEAFKMAQEWGVKFLREKSLYDYLGVPRD